MPSAELVTIGTELLLGEIQDTNTRYLAKKLKDANIDLFRITMIGDNATRIAGLIREGLIRSDIIITTGGLGPTVDDPTRDALALAFDTHTEYHPELWQEIEQRFLKRSILPTENNRRQAFLPAGAEVIHNPVGTAPAFSMSVDNKIVICLPGVPREMEFLTESAVLPMLKIRYNLQGIIKARVIHLAGIGESSVDDIVGEYEKLSNPTVGLLAHPGEVDVRITAKADSLADADRMIAKIEKKIVAAFPHQIFGYDNDTLISAVLSLARQKNATISITSFGLDGYWPTELASTAQDLIQIQNLDQPQTQLNGRFEPEKGAKVQVDCNFTQTAEGSHIEANLLTAKASQHFANIYNGPSSQGAIWATNAFLETLRQNLLNLD